MRLERDSPDCSSQWSRQRRQKRYSEGATGNNSRARQDGHFHGNAPHPDGFAYETLHEDGKPLVVIKTGPIGERTVRGMRHAIAAMAEQETT